ncbi:MAG: hypothetical protein GC179_28970 [Anaerolineaceae bacterium]|nr:hypothetical protein [Anaerolineaceae bacterium]
MNHKRLNWIIGGIVLVIILGVGYVLARVSLVCCTPQGDYFTATTIVELNQTTEAQLHETETAAWIGGFQGTITPTPNPFPYDPTLYAQRQIEELRMRTGAGPTEYAIFYATEAALIATYQGTVLPTPTPIPYTADMSPTALPLPTRPTRTATPTLCPPSDVICPGGNATMSAADKVMVLMASASAPEFGQLAQTATALAVTPTPSATMLCAWSWAHRDLPEIAQAVQDVFVSAGITNVQIIRVDAFGEECGNSSSPNKGFGAMTTDFYLGATVTDFSNKAALAQVVKTAYNTLSALKIKLPAQAGYLDIVFTAGNQEKRFRAMFSEIKPLVGAQTNDEKLLAAGGMQP